MQYSEVKDSLVRRAGGADFITLTQVCESIGIKDRQTVRNRYLINLERVDGKFYYIPDVAKSIMERRA